MKPSHVQVFLGGSCDPTTWRNDIAIPVLEDAGVTFYNPQVPNYSELDDQYKAEGVAGGIVEVESKAKVGADILLFVIDGQTRALASIMEAVEYAALGKRVVLVITDVPDKTEIAGQVVTGRELKDVNRVRVYLREAVARYPATTVCQTIEEAVKVSIQLANGS